MEEDDQPKYRYKLVITNIYRNMIIAFQHLLSIYDRITKEKNTTKVFCIGFSKTGTTSLNRALRILGYRALDWPRGHIEPKEGWINYFKKSNYDAFSDAPLYRKGLFKELDEAFTNSKFILTIRDPDLLVKSWNNYFGKHPWAINNESEKNRIIERYNNHKKDVINYFEGKSSQLLIFNVFDGDSWEKLCKFLDKPVPKIPFPHKRKAKYKYC